MQETRFCIDCNNDVRTNNGKTETNKNGLCNNCQRCCSSPVITRGRRGPRGPAGPQGPIRETGPEGPQGPAGGVLNFADFYALMSPDNAAPVAIGADVDFPQDGPNSGTDITRLGADSFNLAQIGTYQIQFHVSVDEAAQLILTLNGEDLEYTVAGRATASCGYWTDSVETPYLGLFYRKSIRNFRWN